MNQTNLTALCDALDNQGFKQLNRFDLQKGNVKLLILDQRYDGIELHLNTTSDSIRIDFILEYYLTGNTDLTNDLLRTQKLPIEYYLQFITLFFQNLADLSKDPKDFFTWYRSSDFELNSIMKLLS